MDSNGVNVVCTGCKRIRVLSRYTGGCRHTSRIEGCTYQYDAQERRVSKSAKTVQGQISTPTTTELSSQIDVIEPTNPYIYTSLLPSAL